MADVKTFPNFQDQAAGALPVYIVSYAGGTAVAASPSQPYTYTPLGYQQITSLTTAQHLTPPAGATVAIVTCETAAVRYRDDGTAPTAGIGMPLAVGGQLTYSGSLTAIQFIAQTGNPVLDISYYK